MTARRWDMGDPEPQEIIAVRTPEFGEDEDGRPLVFGHTVRNGWKGYVFGGKLYLDWEELLRRFGPVEEVL